MKRKQKRNKKYNPNNHRRDSQAIDRAISLVLPLEEDAKQTLLLDVHSAISAFTAGQAQRKHFDILASTVDVSMMILINLFKDSEALREEVKLGWEGMVRARQRYKHTDGRLGLDGAAFNAIKRVCEIYEAIINDVTGKELLDFYRAREIAIEKGNYYKGDETEYQKAA